jgi:hypothetical protein
MFKTTLKTGMGFMKLISQREAKDEQYATFIF